MPANSRWDLIQRLKGVSDIRTDGSFSVDASEAKHCESIFASKALVF